MAKTKKAAQPVKDGRKTAAKPAAPAKDETTAAAPAKAKKGEERKWDSSKGYTGTQSGYKPPDTDPALTQVRHGGETK